MLKSLRKNIHEQKKTLEFTINLLKQLNEYNLKNFLPVVYQKKKVGWLHRSNIKLSRKFNQNPEFLRIEHVINYSEKRMNLIKELKKQEYCPIFNFNSLQPKVKFNHLTRFCNGKIFQIERRFLQIFGLPAYGVHCNVWSKVGNSTVLHLAKRSKKIRKFPGFLDNLVAGGQPIKISIKKNLHKEAYEEAGLSQKHMQLSTKGKTVHYHHIENNKFHSAIIFIYHLEKTDGMKFRNLDGEVESFISLDINNLYEILEAKQLKPNCILPIVDFFISKDNDFLSKKAILEIRKLLKFYD